jgi:glycosyltransferase involved in cell wall biosynthesis
LRPTVSVVIPALNEAANLPHVLAEIPEWVSEVILVDGASTDGTAEVARRVMPSVKLVEQPGRGKGDALAAGFAVAQGDVIVMLDADGSTNAGEIPRFIEALTAGADLVKGSRNLPGGGSDDFTRLRSQGNSFLTVLVNLVFGTSYSDLCYGYMAFWRRCVDRLRPDRDGFEIETLLAIRAAQARLAVTEIPSYERRRLHGSSRLNVTRDGLRILRVILEERLGGARAVRHAAAPGLRPQPEAVFPND